MQFTKFLQRATQWPLAVGVGLVVLASRWPATITPSAIISCVGCALVAYALLRPVDVRLRRMRP
jgi:hypothetical protein